MKSVCPMPYSEMTSLCLTYTTSEKTLITATVFTVPFSRRTTVFFQFLLSNSEVRFLRFCIKSVFSQVFRFALDSFLLLRIWQLIKSIIGAMNRGSFKLTLWFSVHIYTVYKQFTRIIQFFNHFSATRFHNISNRAFSHYYVHNMVMFYSFLILVSMGKLNMSIISLQN